MKNFLLKTLTIIFAFTLILGIFTACGELETPAHTHDYKTLKYDTENHWYECECGEKQSVEKHKGGTATCTEKASCEVCREKYGELGECNYVNKICAVCGAKQPSEGLFYKPITIGGIDGFCVLGIGTCTDTEVVIANKYLNKPVLSIDDYAFSDCYSLTSVVIPNSVTSIGNRAFYYCRSLTSIVIPNSVTSIGNYAFYYCDSLEYNISDGLKYLGNSENQYLYLAGVVDRNITTATINNNCKVIGYDAFYNCESLTSIVIPNRVTSIGNRAFYYCSSLTNIEIPNSVTSIGGEAFVACTSLTSVVIGNNVTSIGYSAFFSCKSLKSIEIPNSVTSIGSLAFSDCTSLISIVIPNSVTSIGDNAFSACTSLTSIEIPNSVISIGDWAFYYCTSLTSIVIPNSVTSIGDWAFEYCHLLTIYCKAGSKPIGWSMYWNFSNRPVVWGYKGN